MHLPLAPIAIAQTVPKAEDVQGNIEQHLRLAHAAADEGAKVVVFPELSLTGYELGRASELAFSLNDNRLDRLREAASSKALTLVVGAPVLLNRRLHIGAFILDPAGGVDVYTKQRLGQFAPDVNPNGPVPPGEPTVFEPGDRNPLLDIAGQKAALAICADIGRASHAEAAAARGARAYLVGMFVIPADFESDSEKLRGYATTHRMVVALANFGGPTGGLPTAGRSTIWNESGDIVTQLTPQGIALAIAKQTSDGWSSKTLALKNP